MKYLLFTDSDTCLEFKTEKGALKSQEALKIQNKYTILVIQGTNFYTIVNRYLKNNEQVYDFNEVLRHVGSFSF